MRNIFLLAFLLVQVAFADGGFVHHGLHANSCPEGQYALSITARGLLGCGEPGGGGGGSGDVTGSGSPSADGFGIRELPIYSDDTGKVITTQAGYGIYPADKLLELGTLWFHGVQGTLGTNTTGSHFQFQGSGTWVQQAMFPYPSIVNFGVASGNTHYPFGNASVQKLHLGYDQADTLASVSAGVVKVKPGVDFGVTSDKFTVSGGTVSTQYSATANQIKLTSDSGGKIAKLDFVDLSGTTPTTGFYTETTPGYYAERIFLSTGGTPNLNFYFQNVGGGKITVPTLDVNTVRTMYGTTIMTLTDNVGGNEIKTAASVGVYPATTNTGGIGVNPDSSSGYDFARYKYGSFGEIWLGPTSGTVPAATPGQIGAPSGTPISLFTTNEGVAMNTTGTKPTCDSTRRNQFFITQGGTGVADVLEVCMKDAADAYAWVVK